MRVKRGVTSLASAAKYGSLYFSLNKLAYGIVIEKEKL